MLNSNSEFDTLVKNIQSLGFDGVLYSFFPKAMYLNDKNQPLIHFSDKYSGFVSHYFKNNYGNNDFVVRLIIERGLEPIDWWQEIDSENVTPEEMSVMLDSRNLFDIQHGLTIPILNGSFSMVAISVISNNPDIKHFQHIKSKHMNALQKIAIDYHSSIISSNDSLRFFIESLFNNLNQTKKDVIKHVISGKPMKSITNDYDITQRYAEKTLIGLRNEFGKISTHELIYLLGTYGIEEYLYPSSLDVNTKFLPS